MGLGGTTDGRNWRQKEVEGEREIERGEMEGEGGGNGESLPRESTRN